MKLAVFFAACSLFCLLLLVFYAMLLCFVLSEKKAFYNRAQDPSYEDKLRTRYHKSRLASIKNYRLALLIMTLLERGEEQKALQLLPFLRRDRLLGVDPSLMPK